MGVIAPNTHSDHVTQRGNTFILQMRKLKLKEVKFYEPVRVGDRLGT